MSGVPVVLSRPVNSMSLVVSGGGGIKKSVLLMPLPAVVVTAIRPDPVPLGTVVDMDVPVEEPTEPRPTLNRKSFLLGVVSKFVPLTVTAVPTEPIVGVKPVMVGIALAEVTVKAMALETDPDGAVTAINPVVAPAGTDTTS